MNATLIRPVSESTVAMGTMGMDTTGTAHTTDDILFESAEFAAALEGLTTESVSLYIYTM
ncbi:hypothetical protein F9278_29745 [Streptomyces phaeolivaceus]|uniref:Uncharacterized protein n=1 Tax=Streptomyces phaeolivaceus TaxID=2653200 RepID=A0A5P8K957_9ACTN|nr:hypothetical protein [Streptomyces phaeolivaceus]QFQ99641.1 hypothetical protein F9278_29745 [Streptomyces phaeolivaceus]